MSSDAPNKKKKKVTIEMNPNRSSIEEDRLLFDVITRSVPHTKNLAAHEGTPACNKRNGSLQKSLQDRKRMLPLSIQSRHLRHGSPTLWNLTILPIFPFLRNRTSDTLMCSGTGLSDQPRPLTMIGSPSSMRFGNILSRSVWRGYRSTSTLLL